MSDVTIYTSSTGGTMIHKAFQSMMGLVSVLIGHDPKVVFIDKDPEERKFAMSKTIYPGKVVWPLLFAKGE